MSGMQTEKMACGSRHKITAWKHMHCGNMQNVALEQGQYGTCANAAVSQVYSHAVSLASMQAKVQKAVTCRAGRHQKSCQSPGGRRPPLVKMS